MAKGYAQSLFRRTILCFMVGWMLALGLSGILARPAAAAAPFYLEPGLDVSELGRFFADLGNKLKKVAIFADLIELAVKLFDLLHEKFGTLFDEGKKIAAALNSGRWFTAIAKKKMLEAETNSHMFSVQTRERMRYTMNNPKTNGVHACRTTLLHQLATTTEDYAEAVSRIVLTALESMYRGQFAAGDNAMFAAMMHQQRCTHKFASPIDGYPNGGDQDCVDEETKVGSFERTFIDADLTPFMMDGAVTLEMPYLEAVEQQITPDQTVKFLQAKPENENQRAWVAALNYCVNLVGPRPVPPYGKERETPYGLMKTVIFSQGLAIEGIGDKQCADLIAYYTRPNPKQNKDLIKKQENLCDIAWLSRDEVSVNGQKLRGKYDNCKNGLSPYQAQMLERSVCKSAKEMVKALENGGQQRKLIPQTLSCNISWNDWQKTKIVRNGSLVDAVETQAAAKERMARMKIGQKSGRAPGLYQFVLDDAMELPEKNLYTVNLVKKRREAARGVPTAADEIDLPDVIDQ